MRSILYDTSVLLPLIVEEHPNHKTVHKLNEKHIQDEHNLFIASHSIAEFFRHITSDRFYFVYSAKQALQIIEDEIISYFDTVDVTTKDYLLVVDQLSTLSLHGAVIYDGLITHAAEKVTADEIVTYNIPDFKRVWPLTGADLIEP